MADIRVMAQIWEWGAGKPWWQVKFENLIKDCVLHTPTYFPLHFLSCSLQTLCPASQTVPGKTSFGT